ncbi:hypothetical protein [Candidatus Regiella insecticola]|nr:hypothetical protein [Candidatus Regiella insecticola]
MSVDILRDSASARSQRRRNLKGEGYKPSPNAGGKQSLIIYG